MVGTLTILYILNWKLSLIVTVVLRRYAVVYSVQRSQEQGLLRQSSSNSLGELDGYIEEMVSGQKVVKGV